MAGRLAPSDETVQTILAALAERNDRVPRVILAQATGQPGFASGASWPDCSVC